MNKFFRSRMIRSMVPYFILAVAVIVAFRLISELGFFADTLSRFWSVITPFLAGAVIAYILNMPCSAIQRLVMKINNPFVKRKSRAISVLILVIIVLVVFAIILNLIIPAIVSSIALFISEFNTYEATVRTWIANINEWDLPEFLLPYGISDGGDGLLAIVEGWVNDFQIDGLIGGIVSGLGGAFSTVFHTFLAIVSSIYLLVEKDRLKAFAQHFLKAVTADRSYGTVMKYSTKIDFNFRMYIYTQTIDGLILGSIMTVVLFLFGSPYFLVLGVILGILNYIPYFGSIIGTALAVLVVAFTQGLNIAVFAAIIMFVIQQIDGNYIQPKLMGGAFSLSPLLIIMSVTIGGSYGGVLGMLMAIPLVAVLKDLLDSYIEYREKKKKEPQKHEMDEFMDRDIW
ncbi:MAG: AI-2E family transporter [Defluviitaleaceae bacterium]|nr:AI-2E family transporter [Defluviitaleaceae bacterium]